MKALVMALATRRGMLGSLVGLWLLVTAALPAWAAEIVGGETVAQWRWERSLVPSSGLYWTYGVATAESALGMRCGGGLEAYMIYRADPQATVVEALRAFWRETGCAVPPQAGRSEAKPDVPWQEWVRQLWQNRTSSDPVRLRNVIENMRVLDEALSTYAPGDDAENVLRLSALLARDRLRELSEKQRTQ